MHTRMRLWLAAGPLAGVLVGLLMAIPAFADTPQPGVVPPSSGAFGKTYAEWSAAWWQYALSIPAATNPLFDSTGGTCQVGQSGNVFFLVGSFVGPVDRTQCHVSAGHALFFPLVNTVDVNVTTQTAQELRAEIVGIEDGAHDLHASIDGVAVTGLDPRTTPYRTKSTVFSLRLPTDNLFGLDAGTYAPAVADGYYLLLPPLSAGPHTLSFGGRDGTGFVQDITYHLMVDADR